MKLICKDKTELVVTSMANSYIKTIGEDTSVVLRIDNPEVSISELKTQLSDENLSQFTIKVDDENVRNYTDYTLYKIIDTLSDNVNSIEVTLNQII